MLFITIDNIAFIRNKCVIAQSLFTIQNSQIDQNSKFSKLDIIILSIILKLLY